MSLKPSFAFTPNLFKLSVPVPAMDVAIFTVKDGELFVAPPARGPPTDWDELVQIHDDRDVF